MSLLDMFNQIKTKGLAPDFVKELLTTTIPKPGLGDSLGEGDPALQVQGDCTKSKPRPDG